MRLVNRFLAPLLALFLLVLAVVTAVEVIATAFGKGPVWVDWPGVYRQGLDRTWGDGAVRVICIAFVLVGLVLLLGQLKPRRLSHLPLRTSQPDLDARVTRNGLATTARAAATGIDGVSGATARVGRRSIQVTARARHRDRDQARALTAPVTQAVSDRLDRLELARAPRLRVRVQPRRK